MKAHEFIRLENTSRLCIHTITTRPWSIEEAIDQYKRVGVKGITLWREAVENRQLSEVSKRIYESGLSIVSLCRGGFFPAIDSTKRQEAIDNNKRAIDDAAELKAPQVVLVCGSVPDQSLVESRKQIYDGIVTLLPYAEERNIKLAVEPLHPMYADNRSAIYTLEQANDLCDRINSPFLGVVVDVYHLWWDPHLESGIRRCGRANRIFAFHISDWKTPTEDLLLDRGLMGEGCIPIAEIRKWVEDAGFRGFIEVEIFSRRYWAGDQLEFLKDIKRAYLTCC